MRNKWLCVDLRTYTNKELYCFKGLGLFLVAQEVQERGYKDIDDLHRNGADDFFGKYETLQQYLSTFPSPEDSRGDGGC